MVQYKRSCTVNNKAEAEKKDLENDLQLIQAKIEKLNQNIALKDVSKIKLADTILCYSNGWALIQEIQELKKKYLIMVDPIVP